MSIGRRFCQRLSLLLYHRKQNIFDKINAITDCRSKKGRYCGHDFLVRFNIDHIAAVTDCSINIWILSGKCQNLLTGFISRTYIHDCSDSKIRHRF